jgi:hypothetical protein
MNFKNSIVNSFAAETLDTFRLMYLCFFKAVLAGQSHSDNIMVEVHP